MSIRGDAGGVHAFAAALAMAADRLERLSDAAGQATRSKAEEAREEKRRRQVTFGGLGAAAAFAAPASRAAATQGYDQVVPALETALQRALAKLPGIGAAFGQATGARDRIEREILSVAGPIAAAGGKVTPELIKSLFDVHAPRVKRMQQAELATEAFMNASQQRRVTERNTGVDAWKWLFRETAKTVGGVLDDIGANYFK